MINILQDPNVVNDLSYKIDSTNNMNLIIDFTNFKNELCDITNTKGQVSIPFQANKNYDKMISIFLKLDGNFVIDEILDNEFYCATIVQNSADRICWFTIPANYSDTTGLNSLDIYCKGGNIDANTTAN